MDFRQIIAVGLLLAVHSHLKPNRSGSDRAVVNIFYMEDDKILERLGCDAAGSIQAENRNSMF